MSSNNSSPPQAPSYRPLTSSTLTNLTNDDKYPRQDYLGRSQNFEKIPLGIPTTRPPAQGGQPHGAGPYYYPAQISSRDLRDGDPKL